MLAVVKTSDIDVRIQGKNSPFMMEVLKKEYGRKLRLEADDEESVAKKLSRLFHISVEYFL